jgi:hypothetical protein
VFTAAATRLAVSCTSAAPYRAECQPALILLLVDLPSKPLSQPQLRKEVWSWLEAVVTRLNHEYVWDVANVIPPCWPHILTWCMRSLFSPISATAQVSAYQRGIGGVAGSRDPTDR